jgi:hypothetical protein
MDPILAFAGFGVGIVVGLTGMGGGALMTPILVLVFGVPPIAAVSSDLAASAVMKPFGGVVHARRRTVNWPMVAWLCAGSVPSAFLGVLLLRRLGDDDAVQQIIRISLGVALLLAAGGLLAKSWIGRTTASGDAARVRVRPVPTVLLALYPTLRANDLVGTDLVQAVPLVTAAALGHAFFGDLHLDITGAVLVGSIPGVLLGARISSRAPAALVRAALVVVLVASALKLLDVPTALVGLAAAAMIAAYVVVAVRRHATTDRRTAPSPAATTAPGPAAHSSAHPGPADHPDPAHLR